MSFAHRGLGEAAPGALGQNRHLRADVNAGLEVALPVPVLVDALVAGADPHHPVPLVEEGRPGEAAHAVDPPLLRLGRQPLHQMTQADHVVAVIPQGGRGDGQAELRVLEQVLDTVLDHFRGEGRTEALEVREQFTQGRRVEDRAGYRVGPNSAAFSITMIDGSSGVTPPRPARSVNRSLRRMAAASPAGPPPTIRTSVSRVSRSWVIVGRFNHNRGRRDRRACAPGAEPS